MTFIIKIDLAQLVAWHNMIPRSGGWHGWQQKVDDRRIGEALSYFGNGTNHDHISIGDGLVFCVFLKLRGHLKSLKFLCIL